MLTPAFELRQDATFLTVIINARYAKVPETEVFVDGTDFKFYSKPYFLRLNLPGRLVEDGREKASYDVESGTFTITIPKETPNETFQGLDLITRLLAPQGQTSAKEPTIQILDGSDTAERTDGGDEGEGEEEEEEESFDWQVSQQPFSREEEEGSPRVGLDGAVRYGFANRRSGVFKRLRDEICGVVDIEEADAVPLPQRKRAKMAAERDKFDDSHYLADLYQDDVIRPLLQYKPSWVQSYKKMREKIVAAGEAATNVWSPSDVPFSEDEKELMRKLSPKEFLLTGREEREALHGVADILFAYAYNVRTSEGENNVESAWTVCKLSSTLSYLDSFTTPRELVVACCRRALCFPLYRNWALCCKVLKDVRMILRLGCNQVLKCFFEIHKLLSADEPRYILNDLYISDYCVWLQSVSSERLQVLEQEIGEVQVEKKDVGLDLDDLEEAASAVTTEDSSPSSMETGVQVDSRRNGHHDDHHHHRHQQQEQSEEVVHQMGYPDLIQKSIPGPDIVTTHVVRTPREMGDARRNNGVDMEEGCNPEEEEEEEEDSDDESNIDDEDEESTTDDNEVKEGNRSEKGGDCSEHSNTPPASTPQPSLERDFVDKVTIATNETTSSTFHEQNKVTSRKIQGQCNGAQASPQGGHSGSDTTALCGGGGGGVGSFNGGGGGGGSGGGGGKEDTEVVETMKEMLHQLSLDPSSSDTHISSENLGDSNSTNFTEWAKAPPKKLIEPFDGL